MLFAEMIRTEQRRNIVRAKVMRMRDRDARRINAQAYKAAIAQSRASCAPTPPSRVVSATRMHNRAWDETERDLEWQVQAVLLT